MISTSLSPKSTRDLSKFISHRFELIYVKEMLCMARTVEKKKHRNYYIDSTLVVCTYFSLCIFTSFFPCFFSFVFGTFRVIC